MDYVVILVLAIFSVNCVKGWDSVMDDRFAFYFHTLNTNGDDVVSLDDMDTCVGKEEQMKSSIRVRVKCEEFLPRWFIHCIMGGHDGLSEPDFVGRFKELESVKGEEKFSQILFRCMQVGYRLMDLNSNGVVSSDENSCMTSPEEPLTAARDLTTFLLNDTPENYVPQDERCPWVGASRGHTAHGNTAD